MLAYLQGKTIREVISDLLKECLEPAFESLMCNSKTVKALYSETIKHVLAKLKKEGEVT